MLARFRTLPGESGGGGFVLGRQDAGASPANESEAMSPLARFSRLNKTFCNPSLTLKLRLNIKKNLQMWNSFDWVFDVSFSLGLKRALTGLDNPSPHLITH